MKKQLQYLLLLILPWLSVGVYAQETFPVNGMHDKRIDTYAFTNATIFTDYQTKLEKATLLIQGEKIVDVGTRVTIPKGAIVVDLQGKFIYPSFIDLHTNYGLPKAAPNSRRNYYAREQILPKTTGAYNANDAIKAGFKAVEVFQGNEKQAKGLRNLGFGTVLSFRGDGVARGSSVLVTLSDDVPNKVTLKKQAAAHYSFQKGSSQQTYPVSIMGFVALLRQTYLDAAWYKGAKNENFTDLTLDAWNELQALPQLFETRERLNLVRADKIGDEFGVQYIIKGSGDEYQRIDEVKATKAPLIIPVNFPNPYDVADPYDAMRVSLRDMMHWEQAPANLSVLEKNDVEFSLTTAGLKNNKGFWKNLRKAISMGLPEQAALKALTHTPAKLIRADALVGSLGKGKLANFLISSANIFDAKSKLYENWIQGEKFVIKRFHEKDHRGTYALDIKNATYKLEISGESDALRFKVYKNDTVALKARGSIVNDLITLSFKMDPSPKSKTGATRLSGWIKDKAMQGEGQREDGTWITWTAKQTKAFEAKSTSDKKEKQKEVPLKGAKMLYPFVAYGNQAPPKQSDYLIKNATVWTNEEDGIVENTDVLVKNGKIAQIGKGLKAGGATVIDGQGKHLTSGIIDEHSHIALSSVNDVATVSSMVRMEDAVDPEDIDIYRQLAGGVTTAQLLHGSANPVGGQSAIVKMRWGASAEGMLLKSAPGFIKFALGENVKRSRSNNSIRYPLTRMGVEQVYVDAFTRAKEYDRAMKAYQNNKSLPKPRKNLELEAMAEILNGERFITCHSYVQSEINMLMKVADKFDFTVNTFTHILEGYKVADKMKAHGAGASTFSDWWAYKFEVRDAIPYNPILMHNLGVVTAINSDDAEMGRRLNQEAAKSVKYGGMSQEDAWKLVTLNPAKLLHIEGQTGSIKVGKDADLVLWTDNPLSIYAKAEKTMVDGIVYFDVQKDLEMREFVQAERNRLIQKMNNAKGSGAAAQVPRFNGNHSWHCDHVMGVAQEDFEE